MRTRLLPGIRFVIAVGLIGITGLAFPEIAFASKNDPSPTITVQLYNYSQAAPAPLSKAEREADRILSAAGLRVVWLECPVQPSAAGSQGPCQKAPEATDLRLRVLAIASHNKFQDTVTGFTVHPVLASVYYDYASRRAKSDDAEFETPHNPGLRDCARTRSSAAWHEQPLRHRHYAAAVGTESVPAVDDGDFAVHAPAVKGDGRGGAISVRTSDGQENVHVFTSAGLTLNPNIRSSILVYDRASDSGSPLTGYSLPSNLPVHW
jgi:hypothetical protein